MASHTLNFPGANLNTTQVTTSQLTMNTVNITSAFSLDNICVKGNTTSRVVQFTNPTTAFVTTANVDVGGELQVAGNATVSSNLTVGGELAVTGNATVSSNLTVAGDATVSSNLTVGGELAVTGNATVTGDLNVSGALGILDAIYPVGSIIDRATAITDTHLNGKYKAFLSAPNQEWELVPSVQCSFNVYWDPSVASIYYAPGTHIQDWKVATHGHDTGGDFQLSGTNSQKFVAPSNGTYLFGLKYFPTSSEAIGNVALFKNGVYKDTLFATNHTGIYRIRTGVTTLLLTAGDVVHLGMSRAGDTWYKVDPHTQPDFIPARFYGFKIEGSHDTLKYERTA